MTAVLASVLLAGSLVFAADAVIEDDTLRLGQVADLSSLPAGLRGKADALPLARVAQTADAAVVPTAYLVGQARARMPALTRWLPPATSDIVRLHRTVPASAPTVQATEVRNGDIVSVRIVADGFAIERQGTALADAHPGERLFVRTAEGQVILAHCPEAAR